MTHPATIELAERLAEIAKHLGAALLRWAVRMKTEPPQETKPDAPAKA